MAPRPTNVAVKVFLTALLALCVDRQEAALLRSGAKGTVRNNHGIPVKQQWPWYKSGDELHTSFEDLAGNCNGADFTIDTKTSINTGEAAGEEVRLDVLRVRRGTPKLKAMFVYGEHARELITGEAALGFANSLCGKGAVSDRAHKVLDNVEFVLVPNANPVGRKKVEDGFYCKRTNEDGVDLNRNWSDEHKDAWRVEGDEMFPGTNAFSEPETQLIKGLVDQERPDIYLSVHSGAYLLGMPYGYSQQQLPENNDEAAMRAALAPISKKYCGGNCPFGNLAHMIHYQNPGCDIDYVYDRLSTPYVFTWEIFVGPAFREGYIAEAHDQDDSAAAVLAQKSKSKLRVTRRDGIKMKEPEMKEDINSCMEQFNPHSEEETKDIVDNWSGAFLELCEEVYRAKNGGSATATGNTTANSSATPQQAATQAAPLSDPFAAQPAALSDPFAAQPVAPQQPAPQASDPLASQPATVSEPSNQPSETSATSADGTANAAATVDPMVADAAAATTVAPAAVGVGDNGLEAGAAEAMKRMLQGADAATRQDVQASSTAPPKKDMSLANEMQALGSWQANDSPSPLW